MALVAAFADVGRGDPSVDGPRLSSSRNPNALLCQDNMHIIPHSGQERKREEAPFIEYAAFHNNDLADSRGFAGEATRHQDRLKSAVRRPDGRTGSWWSWGVISFLGVAVSWSEGAARPP